MEWKFMIFVAIKYFNKILGESSKNCSSNTPTPSPDFWKFSELAFWREELCSAFPYKSWKLYEAGMPSLQLWDHISSLQIRSKLKIESFSFGPPFGFQANDEKFSKIIFWYPFKKFSPAWTPKRVGIPHMKFTNENLFCIQIIFLLDYILFFA